jgi:hypothetical protein
MLYGALVVPPADPAQTISPLARHLYEVSTWVEVAGTASTAGGPTTAADPVLTD